MEKMPYTLRAIMGDPHKIYKECADDVKKTVVPVLDKYDLMDLPLVIASLKLLAAALEQHPLFGASGIELENDMLKNLEIITLSAIQTKENPNS